MGVCLGRFEGERSVEVLPLQPQPLDNARRDRATSPPPHHARRGSPWTSHDAARRRPARVRRTGFPGRCGSIPCSARRSRRVAGASVTFEPKRARPRTPIRSASISAGCSDAFASSAIAGFVQKRTRLSTPRVQYSCVRCDWRQHVTWRMQCTFGQFATRSRL
ncbi:MAG: hypothetical protein QOC72_2214 [Methylobacteriaceae bacterium]|nr:hypothetical protein [Methylobacteriaceae bacterium]